MYSLTVFTYIERELSAARLFTLLYKILYITIGTSMKLEEIEELIKLMQKHKVHTLKLGDLELHLAEFPIENDEIEDNETEEDILFYSSEG